MHPRYIIQIIILLLCLSCTQQNTTTTKTGKEKTNITTNENKGLKSIFTHYGGQSHFSKTTSPATPETPAIRSFEIELSNSKLTEELKHIIDFPSSNIAYLFFRELEEERKSYDEIHTVILLSDGQKTTTKYPVDDLELVLKKMKILDKIVVLLKAKKYSKLELMINSKDLVAYNKAEMIENLKAADAKYGAIQSFEPFGFRRKKTTDGQRILHLSGYLNRSIKNNEFSIDLAMDSEKEEVYLLQYVL